MKFAQLKKHDNLVNFGSLMFLYGFIKTNELSINLQIYLCDLWHFRLELKPQEKPKLVKKGTVLSRLDIFKINREENYTQKPPADLNLRF